MQWLMAQKSRRAQSAAGGASGGTVTDSHHPDLREGVLKADLPKAYVSEISYGHRLLLSVNISVPVVPHSPPPNLDAVGHLLMRVTARDFSAAELDQMFPGISIYARMRWDPELAPPLEAIRLMSEMRNLFYGDGDEAGGDEPREARRKAQGAHVPEAAEEAVYFNHTRHTCPKGSFRRSKHAPSPKMSASACPAAADVSQCFAAAASCPADEWPSLRLPQSSWVMHRGSAQQLLVRIEAWRTAVTRSKAVALEAVPLSLMVRREIRESDANWAVTQLESFNLSSLDAPRELTSSKQKAAISAIRQRLRDKSIMEYSTSTCMQSSLVPLPLMLAFGDVLVFLSLILLVMFCAWVYLLSGFVIARLSHLVGLPFFLQVRAVPVRLYLLSFRARATVNDPQRPHL